MPTELYVDTLTPSIFVQITHSKEEADKNTEAYVEGPTGQQIEDAQVQDVPCQNPKKELPKHNDRY